MILKEYSSSSPRIGISLVLALLTVLLTACSEGGEWHEKLAIEVETPDGVKRAHSVLAMEKYVNTGFFGAMDQRRAQTEFSGEAVVLEVRPGRYLFVLLTGFRSLSRMTFHHSVGYPRDFAEWAEAMEDVRERRDVPRDSYPLMVTFTDIADPATVTRVDPDNLAATFGPGTRLRSLTLEITDEPVTEGRVERLEFFGKLKMQSTLSGLQKFDPNMPDEISYLTDKAFQMEN